MALEHGLEVVAAGDLGKYYELVEMRNRAGIISELLTALGSWGSVHPPIPLSTVRKTT